MKLRRKSAYSYRSCCQGLVAAAPIELENSAALGAVVELYANPGYDLADRMIRPLGIISGARQMLMFDAPAAQLEEGTCSSRSAIATAPHWPKRQRRWVSGAMQVGMRYALLALCIAF